ncbi:hypothetical protein PPS11_03230 [Pseudomonas putida S11]|nr:hypothetical protein PPS11_03230 [Pseudomonas putida S11]
MKAQYGDDLEHGEPELELPVARNAEQVGQGQQGSNGQCEFPGFDHGEPGMQDCRCGNCLDGNDQHPEPPVQPSNGKTGRTTHCAFGIGGKRTGIRGSNCHFTEHAHDQHNQCAGHDVGQDGRWAGCCNCMPRSDEKAGTDSAGYREHGDVALLEAGGQS